MTKEELAVRIKDGDTACTEKLWKNLYRFLYKLAGGIYTRYRKRCAAAEKTAEHLHKPGHEAHRRGGRGTAAGGHHRGSAKRAAL